MGPMIGLPLPAFFSGPGGAFASALTQFLLAAPVVFVNFTFYRMGMKTLFAGAPNMDSLIALGSGAAMIFGVYALYKMAFALGAGDMETARHFGEHLYFESAAMILTLITLGKFFEARAKGKTSDAIAKLMDLAPKTATVLREGAESVIPLEDVASGDVLVVKTGEHVPVDGVILEGRGLLDESALTGESMPAEKGEGDAVTGATINTAGHFLMRATRVGRTRRWRRSSAWWMKPRLPKRLSLALPTGSAAFSSRSSLSLRLRRRWSGLRWGRVSSSRCPSASPCW